MARLADLTDRPLVRPAGARVVIDLRLLQEPQRAPITASYLGSLLAGYAAEPLPGEDLVVILRRFRPDPDHGARGGRSACRGAPLGAANGAHPALARSARRCPAAARRRGSHPAHRPGHHGHPVPHRGRRDAQPFGTAGRGDPARPGALGAARAVCPDRRRTSGPSVTGRRPASSQPHRGRLAGDRRCCRAAARAGSRADLGRTPGRR